MCTSSAITSALTRPRRAAWLDKHPRFRIHFTPTGSSWINQVERLGRGRLDDRGDLLRCPDSWARVQVSRMPSAPGPWPSTRTSAHGSRTRTTTQGRSPGPRPQRTSWIRWPGTWPGSHPGLAKRQGTSIPDSRRISWPARRFRTAAARGPRSAGRAGRPGCRPCPHKERGPGHTATPRSWPVSCRCSSPLSTASRAGR